MEAKQKQKLHLSFGDKRAGAGPNVTDLTLAIIVISNRRSLQILFRLFPKTKNKLAHLKQKSFQIELRPK